MQMARKDKRRIRSWIGAAILLAAVILFIPAPFASAEEEVLRIQASDLITGAKNTTLAAIFTNGDFDTASLKKVAAIASAGMARSIRPVFTMADGDTVYAVSVGKKKLHTDVNTVGILAAIVLEKAIADAVTASRIPDEAFLSRIH